MISTKAQKTAEKYQGYIAGEYEGKRVGKPKWQAEDDAIRMFLAPYMGGTEVLDCPVGTGRFLPFYEGKGFKVTGVDVSEDMMRLAHARIWSGCDLRKGSIFELEADYGKDRFEVAVAVRIMNLITAHDMQLALGQLQRVTRRRVIFNLRVWHEKTRYRHPQRLRDVTGALMPGWSIAANEPLHEDDFRMIVLSRGDAPHRPCAG